MDKYYRAFKEIRGNRDVVFETVLNHFNKRPIEILEIGCARNLDITSRRSDGWSTCFWADYISQNGGFLTSYDINKESIENCKELISYWMPREIFDHSADFEILNEECENFEGFELAFLDGGDDPNQTLEQFNKCKEAGVEVILIDDFHTKGKLLPNSDTLWYWDNGHKLAAYGLKLGEIKMEIVE